ncbi:hypothetical protein WJX82_001138 [Trebouxia sp. C0006]
MDTLRSFEECLYIDRQQRLLPLACGEHCSVAELECDIQHRKAAEWRQLAPCLRVRGQQCNLTKESGSQRSGASASDETTVSSEEVLASHGWFHEASPCISSWTAQSIDYLFICAPYDALDLSDAGSCKTEQVVHEDVSDAAGGHESTQLDAHPSVKPKDEHSAQRATKFNQSRIAVLAPNLHIHTGRQTTGVLSSGSKPGPKKPLAALKSGLKPAPSDAR